MTAISSASPLPWPLGGCCRSADAHAALPDEIRDQIEALLDEPAWESGLALVNLACWNRYIQRKTSLRLRNALAVAGPAPTASPASSSPGQRPSAPRAPSLRRDAVEPPPSPKRPSSARPSARTSSARSSSARPASARPTSQPPAPLFARPSSAAAQPSVPLSAVLSSYPADFQPLVSLVTRALSASSISLGDLSACPAAIRAVGAAAAARGGAAAAVAAVALRFKEGEVARENRGGAVLAAVRSLSVFPALSVLSLSLPRAGPSPRCLYPPDPSRALCLLCLQFCAAPPAGSGPGPPPAPPVLGGVQRLLDAPLHACDPALRLGAHSHTDAGVAALRAMFPALRSLPELVLLAPRPPVPALARGPAPAAERVTVQSLAVRGETPEEQQAREHAWLRSIAPILRSSAARELRIVDARHTRSRALHRGVMASMPVLERVVLYIGHVWDYTFLYDALAPAEGSGPAPIDRVRFLELRVRLWMGRSRHDFASIGQLTGKLCCCASHLEAITVQGVPFERLEKLAAASPQQAAVADNWRLAIAPFISAFREVLGQFGPLGRRLPYVRIESLGSPPEDIRAVVAHGLEGTIDFSW